MSDREGSVYLRRAAAVVIVVAAMVLIGLFVWSALEPGPGGLNAAVHIAAAFAVAGAAALLLAGLAWARGFWAILLVALAAIPVLLIVTVAAEVLGPYAVVPLLLAEGAVAAILFPAARARPLGRLRLWA